MLWIKCSTKSEVEIYTFRQASSKGGGGGADGAASFPREGRFFLLIRTSFVLLLTFHDDFIQIYTMNKMFLRLVEYDLRWSKRLFSAQKVAHSVNGDVTVLPMAQRLVGFTPRL